MVTVLRIQLQAAKYVLPVICGTVRAFLTYSAVRSLIVSDPAFLESKRSADKNFHAAFLSGADNSFTTMVGT